VEVPRVEDAVLAQYKHYNDRYRADHGLTHGGMYACMHVGM
jgi:hypothetical protein